MRIGALVAVAGAMMIASAEAEPIVLSPDKSIPIRIDAERIDVDGKIATMSDAQVSQGGMRVRCKTLTVRYDGAKTIQQLECEH